MSTQARPGFTRVGLADGFRATRRKKACASGKNRYATESQAIEGLISARKRRAEFPEERAPENRIYPCDRCQGWHLSSRELHPFDLVTPHERNDGEPWDLYARRLEKKIAAQRAEIVSLLALGHGGANREIRKRVPALLTALAEVTERWQSERRDREALVETLGRKHPFCWLLWRVTLGRKSA